MAARAILHGDHSPIQAYFKCLHEIYVFLKHCKPSIKANLCSCHLIMFRFQLNLYDQKLCRSYTVSQGPTVPDTDLLLPPATLLVHWSKARGVHNSFQNFLLQFSCQMEVSLAPICNCSIVPIHMFAALGMLYPVLLLIHTSLSAFFAILYTSLSSVFIYCRYKFIDTLQNTLQTSYCRVRNYCTSYFVKSTNVSNKSCIPEQDLGLHFLNQLQNCLFTSCKVGGHAGLIRANLKIRPTTSILISSQSIEQIRR